MACQCDPRPLDRWSARAGLRGYGNFGTVLDGLVGSFGALEPAGSDFSFHPFSAEGTLSVKLQPGWPGVFEPVEQNPAARQDVLCALRPASDSYEHPEAVCLACLPVVEFEETLHQLFHIHELLEPFGHQPVEPQITGLLNQLSGSIAALRASGGAALYSVAFLKALVTPDMLARVATRFVEGYRLVGADLMPAGIGIVRVGLNCRDVHGFTRTFAARFDLRTFGRINLEPTPIGTVRVQETPQFAPFDYCQSMCDLQQFTCYGACLFLPPSQQAGCRADCAAAGDACRAACPQTAQLP